MCVICCMYPAVGDGVPPRPPVAGGAAAALQQLAMGGATDFSADTPAGWGWDWSQSSTNWNWQQQQAAQGAGVTPAAGAGDDQLTTIDYNHGGTQQRAPVRELRPGRGLMGSLIVLRCVTGGVTDVCCVACEWPLAMVRCTECVRCAGHLMSARWCLDHRLTHVLSFDSTRATGRTERSRLRSSRASKWPARYTATAARQSRLSVWVSQAAFKPSPPPGRYLI